MEILRIDNCSSGTLGNNSKTYNDDLLIYPDGNITGPWWRKRDHELSMDDVQELIDSSPEVIVAGTGVSGGMKPDRNLGEELSKLGIEFVFAPNGESIKIFNRLVTEKRVGCNKYMI